MNQERMKNRKLGKECEGLERHVKKTCKRDGSENGINCMYIAQNAIELVVPNHQKNAYEDYLIL